MALVSLNELLIKAKKENYAVGAFNVANMEMILGALKAAEELNSPIILQIAEVRLKYSPLHLIGPMMVAAGKKSKIPVVIHLDHGMSEKIIGEALKIGFSSVMIDGSEYTLDKNIILTNNIKKMANKYNASVEGEIGVIGGSEDNSRALEIQYARVDDVIKFYERTKISAIAVAIGNAHGIYKSTPKLNLLILDKIVNRKKEINIVLHGGSGLSEDDFKNCIKKGVTKVNIATSTFNSVYSKANSIFMKKDRYGYYDLQLAEIEGAYENVKKHIKIFGSENKA